MMIVEHERKAIREYIDDVATADWIPFVHGYRLGK